MDVSELHPHQNERISSTKPTNECGIATLERNIPLSVAVVTARKSGKASGQEQQRDELNKRDQERKEAGTECRNECKRRRKPDQKRYLEDHEITRPAGSVD